MCHRCRVDQTGTVRGDISARSSISSSVSRRIAGYEPRRLFNIVEFIMNDRDGSGSVSVEEATQILYLRFGNGLLDKVSFRKIYWVTVSSFTDIIFVILLSDLKKYLALLIQTAPKTFPSLSS